jgi:hypothetical protein
MEKIKDGCTRSGMTAGQGSGGRPCSFAPASPSNTRYKRGWVWGFWRFDGIYPLHSLLGSSFYWVLVGGWVSVRILVTDGSASRFLASHSYETCHL